MYRNSRTCVIYIYIYINIIIQFQIPVSYKHCLPANLKLYLCVQTVLCLYLIFVKISFIPLLNTLRNIIVNQYSALMSPFGEDQPSEKTEINPVGNPVLKFPFRSVSRPFFSTQSSSNINFFRIEIY